MKGRYSALPFVIISLLFLFDSAHSQNIGVLIAPLTGLTVDAQRAPKPNFDNIYIVRPGDTLIGISRIFDTNPETLKSANGLGSSKILIGQKLSIPTLQSAAANERTTKAKDDSALAYSIYTVQPGDNLIKISRMFDTKPETLRSANGFKGSKILIGQSLKIPIPKTAAVEERIPALSYTPSVISNVLLQRDLIEDTKEKVPPRRILLVEAGFKLLGTRYRFGGNSEKYGFDCSGLVKNLFSKFTIDLPHSSREQFKQGEKVDRDKLAEGDLVFFSSGGKLPNHVGIYIGNNQFLHAASKAKKVIISDLDKLWYSMRYLGARRITDLWWEDQDFTTTNN